MVGGLGNFHTQLVAVLHLQVVLQHDDREAGVKAGHTVSRGEDVPAGDDDSTALVEVVLVPDRDQPGNLARPDRSTTCLTVRLTAVHTGEYSQFCETFGTRTHLQ